MPSRNYGLSVAQGEQNGVQLEVKLLWGIVAMLTATLGIIIGAGIWVGEINSNAKANAEDILEEKQMRIAADVGIRANIETMLNRVTTEQNEMKARIRAQETGTARIEEQMRSIREGQDRTERNSEAVIRRVDDLIRQFNRYMKEGFDENSGLNRDRP